MRKSKKQNFLQFTYSLSNSVVISCLFSMTDYPILMNNKHSQYLFFVFFLLNSLDPEQKDQLIEVIEKLLADKTTVSRLPSLCSCHFFSNNLFLFHLIHFPVNLLQHIRFEQF